MGGTVATAFRFKSGEVVCVDTWTNMLPGELKKKAVLIDQDETYVRQLIKEILEYDHKIIPLAPMSYGLNVFDFMQGNMLTMQGFCHFEEFSPIEAAGIVAPERGENFRELVAVGRIEFVRRVMIEGKGFSKPMTAMVKTEELELLIPKALKLYRDSGEFITFRIAAEPEMKFFDFDETTKGAVAYKKKLEELGFTFSPEESKVWKEFYLRD